MQGRVQSPTWRDRHDVWELRFPRGPDISVKKSIGRIGVAWTASSALKLNMSQEQEQEKPVRIYHREAQAQRLNVSFSFAFLYTTCHMLVCSSQSLLRSTPEIHQTDHSVLLSVLLLVHILLSSSHPCLISLPRLAQLSLRDGSFHLDGNSLALHGGAAPCRA